MKGTRCRTTRSSRDCGAGGTAWDTQGTCAQLQPPAAYEGVDLQWLEGLASPKKLERLYFPAFKYSNSFS